MHAGEDCIDDAEPSFTPDASNRKPMTGTHLAVASCGRLECPHDGGADSYDPSAVQLPLIDGQRGDLRDAIGLIEGQPQIQGRVSRRRDSSSVRPRGESDAASPPGRKCTPVEHKPRRGGLESDRLAGNRRPDVPQSQRFWHMCVLNGSPVIRHPLQNCFTTAQKTKCDEARVADKTFNARGKWPQREAVARRQHWRGRSVFSRRAMITRPEGKREEAAGIGQRYPAGKPKLNPLAACEMRAGQACR